MLNDGPRILITIGVIIVVIGLLWQVSGKFIPLGRLPGDIVIEKEKIKFYFPIVTCILLSIILSLIAYFIRKF